MKTRHFTLSTGSALLGLGLALALAANPAQAAGVAAGTLIENTATATYTSGSTSGSIQSNTITVKVDELLDVAVAGLTNTTVVAGATNVVLSYSVTNTGNGPEAFELTADPAVAGNDYTVTVQQLVIDTNDNGVYEPGVDQVLPAGSATPSIAADASLRVFVIVNLPAGVTDGQSSQVRLTADAATGTGAPGTTFTGQGEGGGDAVVGSSGASAFGLDTMLATLATVTLTKAAAIADPFGGSQPVPGAVVTYTLTATVSGTGLAEDLRIADAIPAGTTYEPGTLRLDGSGLTDAIDTDAGQASASGIAVELGDVAGGTTRVVTFGVKIN